jgi:hypothetical protein
MPGQPILVGTLRSMKRTFVLIVAVVGMGLPFSASAQIFWKSPDYRGSSIAPSEAGIGVAMPGATADEIQASVAWQMRAGLNIMALQCQFDRTLLSDVNYNAVLINHRAELDGVYKKLASYFNRTSKAPKEAQRAFDQFGTKTYLGMTTVLGQLGFCETASRIATNAAFAPRGSFTTLAVERLRELRNSLGRGSEQQFPSYRASDLYALPSFETRCWDRRGNYNRGCPFPAL